MDERTLYPVDGFGGLLCATSAVWYVGRGGWRVTRCDLPSAGGDDLAVRNVSWQVRRNLRSTSNPGLSERAHNTSTLSGFSRKLRVDEEVDPEHSVRGFGCGEFTELDQGCSDFYIPALLNSLYDGQLVRSPWVHRQIP